MPRPKSAMQETLDLTNGTWQCVPGVGDYTATSTGPAQFTYTNGVALGSAYFRVEML